MINIKLKVTNSNENKPNQNFDRIIEIIENSRRDAFKAVNRELINMYWEIGKFVSEKVGKNKWGKSVVKELSDFIQHKNEGIKGFSPQNIWRMKQFYDMYSGNEKLSPLVRDRLFKVSFLKNLQKKGVNILTIADKDLQSFTQVFKFFE